MSSWSDQLALFEVGYKKFGALDIVLANAGVHEIGNILEDKYDSESGKLLPPVLQTLDCEPLGCHLHNEAGYPLFRQAAKHEAVSTRLDGFGCVLPRYASIVDVLRDQGRCDGPDEIVEDTDAHEQRGDCQHGGSVDD